MIDTALVPCAGLGTRLRPVTRWVPKEVLPVALRPLLHWALDEIADAGLLRAIVIVAPGQPLLETVARAYTGPLVLEFVTQEQPRGLGDALLRSRDALAGAPFLTVLPDNLFDGPNPSAAVLEAYRRTRRATVLLAELSRSAARRAGATGRARVRREDDGRLAVDEVADKGSGRFDPGGAPSALTPIGRFAFPNECLAEFESLAGELPPNGVLDDVPVLQRLARRNALDGVLAQARFYDVGVPEGYHAAVADFPPNLP